MATKAEIRKYMKDHGVSRADAIEDLRERESRRIDAGDMPDKMKAALFTRVYNGYEVDVYLPQSAEAREGASDDAYERHLDIYNKYLGGVESMAYNLYTYVQNTYVEWSANQMGSEPFDAEDSGLYQLGFIHNKADGTMSPCFLDGWEQLKDSVTTYRNWRGEPSAIRGIYNIAARASLVGTIFNEHFNPQVREWLMDIAKHMPFYRMTPQALNNWVAAGENGYTLRMELLIAHEDAQQCQALYRVTD